MRLPSFRTSSSTRSTGGITLNGACVPISCWMYLPEASGMMTAPIPPANAPAKSLVRKLCRLRPAGVAVSNLTGSPLIIPCTQPPAVWPVMPSTGHRLPAAASPRPWARLSARNLPDIPSDSIPCTNAASGSTSWPRNHCFVMMTGAPVMPIRSAMLIRPVTPFTTLPCRMLFKCVFLAKFICFSVHDNRLYITRPLGWRWYDTGMSSR